MITVPGSDTRPARETSSCEPDQTCALVVDDNSTNRRVLELILEAKGIGAAFATNGAEALAMFRDTAFDVVLMDLQMPVMDGFDAIAGIRALEADGSAPRTPVVVVSAFTRASDVRRAAAAGADRHIGKPVDVQQLLGAINELTRH